MKILLIDNYDSFTYNLFHYLELNDARVDVVRNDKVNLNKLSDYQKIVISPGPGLPDDAGQIMQVLALVHDKIPVLGICLGFQAIVQFYGGSLFNMETVLHGKSSTCMLVNHDEIYHNIPQTFRVGRYHSWGAKKEGLVNDLIISAIDENEIILSIKHVKYNVRGIQYHPESVLTEYGKKIISNWLNIK